MPLLTERQVLLRGLSNLLTVYVISEVIRCARLLRETEIDDIDNVSDVSSDLSFSDTSSSSDDFENEDLLEPNLIPIGTPTRQIQTILDSTTISALSPSSPSSSSSDDGLSSSSDSSNGIILHLLLDDNEDNDFDGLHWPPEIIREILGELDYVLHSRYLVPRVRLPKSLEWRNNIALNDPVKRVHAFFRMREQSIRTLVNLLEDHPIFQNNSNCPQQPVLVQVLAFLLYLCSDGRAGSHIRLSALGGYGEGTIGLYVGRVVEALLSFEDDLIRWPVPGTDDYQHNTDIHFHLHGFPNCVGMVDGTLVPLWRRPSKDGSAYIDRKDRYSLNATLVVNVETRILLLGVGCTGSTHDAAVIKRIDLWDNPDDYFLNDSHYILGDGAYPLTNFLIKPFRRSEVSNDPEIRSNFNMQLSSARVNVEHAIGILKMRFPILQRLGVNVDGDDSHERAMKIIRAAACLHNFLLDLGDKFELEPHEREKLIRDMNAAFLRQEESEWREQREREGIQGMRPEGEEAARRDGELKRELLIQQLQTWDGRGGRRRQWWLEEMAARIYPNRTVSDLHRLTNLMHLATQAGVRQGITLMVTLQYRDTNALRTPKAFVSPKTL